MRAAVSALLLAGAAGAVACSFFTTTDDLSGAAASDAGGDAAAASEASGTGLPPPEGGVSGPSSVFASGQSRPTAIATDGTTLFWTNQVAAGALMACPETGCSPDPVSLVGVQHNPAALAIGGTTFWSTLDDNMVWALYGVDGGFAGSKECYGTQTTASPTSLAPIPSGVIWANESGSSVLGCNGDNGYPVSVAQTSPHALVTDATRAFWAAGDKILSVPLGTKCGDNGVACDVIATGVHAHAIAVDVLYLYWADDAGGGIDSVAKSGGAPRNLTMNQNHPWQIALDGNDVVWTNFGSGTSNDGSVVRAAKAGSGAVTVIADALAQPWGIAVGATRIFWTNSGDGTVMSAPR